MELKKFDVFSALIPASTVPKRKAGKIVQRGTYMTTTEYAKHKYLPVSTVRQMYKKCLLVGFNTGNCIYIDWQESDRVLKEANVRNISAGSSKRMQQNAGSWQRKRTVKSKNGDDIERKKKELLQNLL